jgi:hypothetical protein
MSATNAPLQFSQSLLNDLVKLTQMVEQMPVPPRPLRRKDIVRVNDEAAVIVLISVSGNITVRMADGGLRTVRECEITR